jgi:hypothetical protein
MTRRAVALRLALAVTVAGCGALDPYPTQPRTLPTATPAAHVPEIPRVAICYNTLTTTLAEVQTQAQQECAAGTRAEPADTDWYLQSCPLLLPARATFVCLPKNSSRRLRRRLTPRIGGAGSKPSPTISTAAKHSNLSRTRMRRRRPDRRLFARQRMRRGSSADARDPPGRDRARNGGRAAMCYC